MSRAERRPLVERENPTLPVSQQWRLLAVSRSSVYRRPAEGSEEDRAMMALIYLARPSYGSRRMAAWLAIERVNQVWCSDVTYIPMAKGFLYLVV
jgi:putative transposase